MQIKRATMENMYEMQHCNLLCLPENYNLRYYYFHILSWPQLLYAEVDYNDNIAGYVLAKMDDEESAEKKHGHITSLSVLRTHRKLGIASRVMKAAMKEMDEEYGANYCSLHVRRTNDAALHLYQDSLHYRCAGVEEAYYVDNEDAYHMKYFFGGRENKGTYIDEEGMQIHKPIPNADLAAAAVTGMASPGTAAATTTTEAASDKKSKGGNKNNNNNNKKVDAKEMEDALAELLELEDSNSRKGGKSQKGGGKGKKK